MNFSEIFAAYPELIQGAKTTALIFVIAVAFGLAFGSLLALARNSKNKLIQFPAMVYINTFRSIPLIMVLLGFYLAIPTFLKSIGFTDIALPSAIISFCLFESAYFAEVIRSGIIGVSPNQTAAAKSLGLSKWQTSSLVVLPQAFKNSRKSLIDQCKSLLQDTPLVYVIGLEDWFTTAVHIGDRIGHIESGVIVATAGFILVCITLQRLSDKFNNKKGETA
ncbi:glutamate/aspartate ABC transporter membrane subunit GltK [Burkholderia cenocepacia]|uniref:amino acid ABC transporter permease n=1 Tax=Burkholderia cenocepacia TaxID=95486 RepID=UPI00192BDF43|nr:amino acid ABC transporter permease [Burkholderia cenocepacia]CAD9228076.1 glutamate/aspartate ABC transporter membrane subunit GltK [Burkholderia cenocepacia]